MRVTMHLSSASYLDWTVLLVSARTLGQERLNTTTTDDCVLPMSSGLLTTGNLP